MVLLAGSTNVLDFPLEFDRKIFLEENNYMIDYKFVVFLDSVHAGKGGGDGMIKITRFRTRCLRPQSAFKTLYCLSKQKKIIRGRESWLVGCLTSQQHASVSQGRMDPWEGGGG